MGLKYLTIKRELCKFLKFLAFSPLYYFEIKSVLYRRLFNSSLLYEVSLFTLSHLAMKI